MYDAKVFFGTNIFFIKKLLSFTLKEGSCNKDQTLLKNYVLYLSPK